MIDAVLGALADPGRRAALEFLGREPTRAGDLASALGLSAPAMSRHLRVLREAGLVTAEVGDDDARVRLYHLRTEPLGELRRWVDEVGGFWLAELDAFKAFAERPDER